MKYYLNDESIRIIYGITYILYVIFLLDSLLDQHVFNVNRYYSYAFIAFWIVLELVFRQKIIIDLRNPAFRMIIFLFFYYGLFAVVTVFSPMAGEMPEELRACLKFVAVIAVNVYMIYRYELFGLFLKLTFYAAAVFLLIRFIIAGMPMGAFSNLSVIMTTEDRFREAFGFYNVNAAGNLTGCLLIISGILLGYMHCNEEELAKWKYVIPVLFDIIILIMLLSSGSRNSLLELGFFVLSMLYYWLMGLDHFTKRTRVLLRILVLCAALVLIFYTLGAKIDELFVSSLRYKMFATDLPVLISSGRLFQGMGIFSAALFGYSQTPYGITVNVDNYYLFVLMETGILGLCMIGLYLVWIGISLHRILGKSWDLQTMILCASFIAFLFSGMGETSVIYYVFPSSYIFLTIFVSWLSLNYRREEVENGRKKESDGACDAVPSGSEDAGKYPDLCKGYRSRYSVR